MENKKDLTIEELQELGLEILEDEPECRTLVISREFDDELIDYVYDFVSNLKYYDDVDEQPEITIMISSPGGSTNVLFTVADILLGTGLKIKTVVNGYAYSCAFGLFCIGDERIVQPFSELMYHSVSYPMERANIHEHKCTMKDAQRIQNKYDNMIKMNTKITQKQLDKYKSSEWWINPTDAYKWGISTNEW